MNKYVKSISLAVILSAGFAFTACSDDDGDELEVTTGAPVANPVENVLPDGLPAKVGAATFTVNESGQLTKVVDRNKTMTFEYGTFAPSRANNYTVLMKYRNSQYPEDDYDIYMQFNMQGYVSHAHQVYLDEDEGVDDWDFEYNADGQLTRLKRTESDDDFRITYVNGDITAVAQTDESGDTDDYTFIYTNDEHASAVANKGCVMEFDEFFDVDMDEMGWAYYAGFLGKSTKNLPMGYTRVSKRTNESTGKVETETSTKVYHWTFNADQLPTEFRRYVGETLTFSWN